MLKVGLKWVNMYLFFNRDFVFVQQSEMLEKEDSFQSVIWLLLSRTCTPQHNLLGALRGHFEGCPRRTLYYLHRISSKFQLPQQVKVTDVFTLLNIANLQRGTNSPMRANPKKGGRLTPVLFLWDARIRTWFSSRLMRHRRRRLWRPERLVMLFEDRSRTCRLLRFSNPSMAFSWFPLLILTRERGNLKRQGHDTHEYACRHKEFYLIHSRWFSLINIKGAVVALWGACTSSLQCRVEWQACLSLLNPDRWGLTAQQMLRR